MACGKNFKAYLVGGFSALGGFLFGYHTGVISGVLTMKDFTNMTYNYHLKGEDSDEFNATKGGIVGVLLFGCFLGSLMGGQTSDRFSRKYSISVFSFIFTISAAVQTGSNGLIMLLFGRFFAGISIGALSMIVPVYHSEIATTRVRGRIITFQQWAITIGIAISFWINYGVHNGNLKGKRAEWQIPLGLQMVPSFILAVGILFCPYSPRWLVSHDREDDARDVLTKIRSASHDEIEEEMDRIKGEVAYLRENEIESYRQLFRSPLLRPFLLGIGIQILQQFTGINATIYYAPDLFNTLSQYAPLLATGVYGCVNVIATIPTMIFIDKLGRRILLLTGALIMSISMLIAGIVSVDSSNHNAVIWTKLVFIHIFIGGFAFSWGPIPWVFCAEIFPLTIRAKATSLTTAANWATNCLISFTVSLFINDQPGPFFITFSIFCAIMIPIVYYFYPETKNIHLEEIDVTRAINRQNVEQRRTDYNTFAQQSTENRTNHSITNEQNLNNQQNQINHSNFYTHRDDSLQQEKASSNETVN